MYSYRLLGASLHTRKSYHDRYNFVNPPCNSNSFDASLDQACCLQNCCCCCVFYFCVFLLLCFLLLLCDFINSELPLHNLIVLRFNFNFLILLKKDFDNILGFPRVRLNFCKNDHSECQYRPFLPKAPKKPIVILCSTNLPP